MENTYKEIYNEVESIVRGEGDLTLNIHNFIAKMKREMTSSLTLEQVSDINGIPLGIIERIEKLDIED